MVTTAITNLDLHDISRSARSYGLLGLWVTHPVSAQRELALRVKEHWTTGSGARRIPDRTPALEGLRVVASLDDAIVEIGPDVELWTTSAAPAENDLSWPAARTRIAAKGPPILIVLGTGWGLAPEVHARAAARLAPIESAAPDGYNHLSVRAAAAIACDRLLGRHESS